jgi:hypothetical protein
LGENCQPRWAIEHAEDLGGDPDNVTVIGQSAGAHLASLALISAAEKEAGGVEAPWCSGDIARFVFPQAQGVVYYFRESKGVFEQVLLVTAVA